MAKQPTYAHQAYTEALNRIEACRKQRETALNLSEIGLTTIPPEISRLTALRALYLSNNQLTTLPPEIGHLAALEALWLTTNQLTTLPAEIGRLTALTTLNLGANQLTTLPPEIGRLTAIKELTLYKNKLTSLPPELGRLTALTTLYLGSNQLTTLPPAISRLNALTELDLSGNNLMALPQEIGGLTSLTKLNLAANRITTIPPEIARLAALRKLDLNGNRLTLLPPEIGRLTALTVLCLDVNELTSLPVEITQLKTLKRLDLHDNPGLGIPMELLGPGWMGVERGKAKPKPPREILDAYFRILGEAGEALGESKLIVVGRGGAGKTSLLKRLNKKPYDPNEPETHSIQIQNMTFAGQRGQVKARVWDFGGQVVLHSMHEFFLTARSLYMLVLGEREDMLERDAAYWLQLIRSYAGPDVPVVVALNKSAGRQRTFDRETLERNYGPILGWVVTECSEPDLAKGGITALREALAAALDSDHMETVRRKFPKKWRPILTALESMKQSYLDYKDYVKECDKLGEKDPKEQAALAGDLHDLGVALNYARDQRLRDTTILRPDWLANGIYAVLRANDLDDKLPGEFNRPLALDGVINAEVLERIHKKAEAWGMLKASDYPLDKREFLLRLMDQFHISYPLDDEGKEQLVPSLLSLNPPSGTDEPEGTERVRLRYEFHVVPSPLLPWFIARTFASIPNRLHWRRGAMLEFADAKAKVWATQDERYVFVTVAGPEHDRNRLLAMIRGMLHKIFGDYKALNPVEQWERKGTWVPRATLEDIGELPREGGDAAEEVGWSEEVES